MREQHRAVWKSARAIAEKAQSECRDLTASEGAEFHQLLAKADDLAKHIKEAGESQGRFKKLAEITHPEADASGRPKAFLGRRSSLAGSIVDSMGQAGSQPSVRRPSSPPETSSR